VDASRGFRFSTNIFGLKSGADFTAWCRRVEDLGYDTLFATDHLGGGAPFQLAVAAARATSRLRAGTLVLNAPFWNPALLAREIVTADILTDGRLEVGLGAGHMKWEFDEAGIAWEGFAARAERMTATIAEVSRILAAGGYEQRRKMEEHFGLSPLLPVQRRGFGGYGPPLLVAGTGERVLSTAAAYADIVGIAGTRQVAGQPPGTLRLCTAAEADDVVALARARAGARAAAVEWQVLVQLVRVTDDRRAVAEELAAQYGEMSPEDILATPFLLIGTVDEIAARVTANRERYGFTYFTVHGPYAEEFAPVIERVRASSG
jgi:probable F420-dependent oxidoreductase